MVRSSWIGPVIVGLAVAGLAWSQTGSPAPTAAETKERTLTLQEAQRPAQKCKLLRSWCQADGTKAYLVQSLSSGEFITIAEITDSSSSSKAVATKIYHWGDGQKPPADTPETPNNALILGNPIARFGKALPPASTTVVHSDLPPPAPVKQEMPPSVPLRTDSKPIAVTTSLPDSKALVQSMGPSLSPLPIHSGEAQVFPSTPKVPESDLIVIVPLPTMSETKSPQPETITFDLPDSKPAAPPVVSDTKPALSGTALPVLPQIKPAALPAGATNSKSATAIVVAKSTETPSVPPAPKPTQLAAPVTVTTNPPSPSSDWRQSWGRVDVPANSSVPMPTTAPAVPAKPIDPLMKKDHPAETKLSSEMAPPAQGVVKADALVNLPTISKAPAPVFSPVADKAPTPVFSPVADKTQVQVAWNTVDSRAQANPPVQVTANPVSPPTAVSSLPVVASLPSAMPPATSWPSPTAGVLLPPLPPPPAVTPKPTPTPGLQSVAAAMQVQPTVQNVQIADGPNAFSPPPKQGANPSPPAAMPPQTCYPPPQMPVMVPTAPMDTGTSPALANAFTLPGITRPIPANFGPPAQVPNAFSDGNTGSVSYAVMPPPPTLVNPQIPLVDRGPVPVRVVSVNSPIQGAGNPLHLTAILRDSLYPSQREDAAQALANQDWRAQPQLVDALVKAAKEDPAPMVCAECIHSLAHMGVATLPVVKICQALKSDPDPRVRKEAEQALLALVGSKQYDETQFQPASLKTQK